jgi:hypothetical protein
MRRNSVHERDLQQISPTLTVQELSLKPKCRGRSISVPCLTQGWHEAKQDLKLRFVQTLRSDEESCEKEA